MNLNLKRLQCSAKIFKIASHIWLGAFMSVGFFGILSESFGNMLHVTQGDAVTCLYNDSTLPVPYSSAEQKGVTKTALISP